MLVFFGEDCYCQLSVCSRGLNQCSCVGKPTGPHPRWRWLTPTCSHLRTSNFANKCQYRPCKFPCFYSRGQLQWPFKATVPSVSCSFFSYSSWHQDSPLAFASFPFSKLNRTVGVHLYDTYSPNTTFCAIPVRVARTPPLERTEIVRNRAFL